MKAPTHDPMTVLRAMGLVDVALTGDAFASTGLVFVGGGGGVVVGVVEMTGVLLPAIGGAV